MKRNRIPLLFLIAVLLWPVSIWIAAPVLVIAAVLSADRHD